MYSKIINVITGEITQIPLTDDELAKIAQIKAIKDAENIEFAKIQYQRDRAIEYPPMYDYLDGIVKNDQTQIQTYIDACLAVKAKYPKP